MKRAARIPEAWRRAAVDLRPGAWCALEAEAAPIRWNLAMIAARPFPHGRPRIAWLRDARPLVWRAARLRRDGTVEPGAVVTAQFGNEAEALDAASRVALMIGARAP